MPLKIKDIAVVALPKDGRNPIGEAPSRGQMYPRMTSRDHELMVDRLFYEIKELMQKAKASHLVNYKRPHTNEIDPNYITRLSTNEFFFYTQEPLTLQDFEALQNKIADETNTLPAGIQFVFGSFAVKTFDNRVMNVTPHITYNGTVSFNFIVKNYTTSIDVRYKEKDTYDTSQTLGLFDMGTKPSHLPQINIKGVTQPVTFNNIIFSKTPGGESLLTVLDICSDHLRGVGKFNIERLIEKDPAVTNLPISHMVLSNHVKLSSKYCFGSVVHIDPIHSPEGCKKGVKQKIIWTDKPYFFGVDHDVQIFELRQAMPCLILQQTLDIHKKIKAHKKLADQFIQEKRNISDVAGKSEERKQILGKPQKISQVLEVNETIKQFGAVASSIIKKANQGDVFRTDKTTVTFFKSKDKFKIKNSEVEIEDTTTKGYNMSNTQLDK